MTARTLRLASALATLALSSAFALAQQPTATVTAASPADSATPAAPIERHAPSDQPGPAAPHHRMRSNSLGLTGPGPEGQPNFHARLDEREDSRPGPNVFFRESRQPRMNVDFHPGAQGQWWKNPMLAQRLTLTPEQTKKLDTISQESHLHLIDLRANVERQQAILEPLLAANPLDTTRALAQVDKLAEARAALEVSQAKTALTLRAVLTPDQWTKLSEHRTFGPHFGFGTGPESRIIQGDVPVQP